MKDRIAVRLILLDPGKRILLMKLKSGWAVETGAPYWIALGGGLEPGESLSQAAAREGWEESGIAGLCIGPVVWYGEQMGKFCGEPCLYRQNFVVAHAPACETSADNWSESERRDVAELRWWTLDELRATSEIVLPPVLVELLPGIIAGEYPETVRTIVL